MTVQRRIELPIIRILAEKLEHVLRATPGTDSWDERMDVLRYYLDHYVPYYFDFDASKPERLVFRGSRAVYNEHGLCMGDLEFKVVVKASLVHGYDWRLTFDWDSPCRNCRNYIYLWRDPLEQNFDLFLEETVGRWEHQRLAAWRKGD